MGLLIARLVRRIVLGHARPNRWQRLKALSNEAVLAGISDAVLISPLRRGRLLTRQGHSIDPSTHISRGCFFGSTHGLAIGARCFVNIDCVFDLSATITIGSRTWLAPEVMLLTSGHEIGQHDERAGRHAPAPIVIGDGVWLGARVTVLPGVTIGDGCVIAAGSVVTRNCAADGLYAGVPASRKRDLT